MKKSTTTHNLSTKVYQKSQPVEIKLIDHYIGILKILFKDNKNVNEVFNILRKETKRIPYQSDKLATSHAIKDLLKSQLVTEVIIQRGKTKRKRIRNRKSKGQKRIIELTPIGKELSKLIYYIHEYSYRYEKLKEVINYHFNSSDIGIKQVILHKRLTERGWQNQEIELYNRLAEGVLFLEAHLPLVILNTLLARYLKIIYTYNSLSILAKEILKRVIIDTITKYILDRLEGILADKVFSGKQQRDTSFQTTYYLLSGWTTSHFRNHTDIFSENRFIQNESLDLVKVLYNILDPPNHFLESVLGREAKNNPKIDQLMKVLEASKDTS